jgi:acetyl-CoA acetyltransferase
MSAATIQALLKRTPNLDPAQMEDVVIGCAFPEGEQGLNMARMIALRAGLPDSLSPLKPSIVIARRVCSPLRMWRMRFNRDKSKLALQAERSP